MARGWRGGPARVGQAFARLGGRLGRWEERGWLTLLGLALVFVFGVTAVLWGAFFADPDIRVQQLDAGPVSQFAISEVVPYPEVNVYLVGLADGRLRALDGIAQNSGCAVDWRPDEERTRPANPGGASGAYVDPCSGAVWTKLGDAFSGVSGPLRTFQIDYETDSEGVQRVWVEVLGKRDGRP